MKRFMRSAGVSSSSSAERPANVPARLSGDNSLVTRLKARRRKRALDSAAEEQRPLAKPKATRGRNKRTAAATPDGVEQSVSKRKERLLTSELFAVGARDGCLRFVAETPICVEGG